ncbi:MAG: DEAD/DEAH box helicase [Mailhella sp.]|nr:DEAD/DEAH box helicase [Mailhella sp.]
MPVPRPQDAVPVPDGNIPGLLTDAWPHQKQAYAFASARRGAMLAMGMGTGKSLTAVALASHDRLTLILCPKTVLSVWPREFARHAAYACECAVLSGATAAAKAKELLARLVKAKKNGEHLVVLVNYDSAWRKPLSDALCKARWDTVILDECHKIKTPSGKASKFCSRLRSHAEKVYGLTGTPMPHSPGDIYAQFRAIDPDVFGSSHAAFEKRYAVKGGYGGYEIIGYRDQLTMRERFLSASYQAGRDVVSLPEATHTVIPVELGKTARTIYRSLHDTFRAGVENGTVTADNALVSLLRLQQLTGGALKTDEGDVVSVSDDKRAALAELLEGMGGEPCVVFCRFVSDMDSVARACDDLGIAWLELSGRRNRLAEWQKTDAAPVLIVQIQAGGVGVDLTRASFCIYYSLGFSLGDYEQSLARVHRPGQEKPVSYYHLIAEDTVDESVYRALAGKRSVVEALLETV